MNTTTKICALALSILLLATLATAQGVASGDLHVTVRDPKGSLVTNATVTAREQGKANERTTSNNSSGEYRLLALAPGQYKVTVEAPGFARLQVENIAITVGQVASLPISLSIATAQESVVVSSNAELVETTRTSTTDTIEQRRIDNLPINGRNYINFALTDSQVVRDNAPAIGAAPTSGLNISGQRGRSNLVNVDGADAVDNSINGVRSTVSQEAVQEFQIITNSYAAEYGRASGGVVNIITRSGSNDFHGDVYGYARNRNFQAVNPFSTVSNPAYTRVQAGAAFGGPIKKDKTYYYFAYEVTRRHETGFSSIGQDNFGMVGTDISPIFGAPPGAGFVIQATPQQAAFFQGVPAAEANIVTTLAPAIGLTAAQQLASGYGQEAALYGAFVGGSSGIAVNGQYPASFAALVNKVIPPATNGSSSLTQFPSSCNFGQPNVLCHGLPASFLTLASQVGNYPVFEGTSLYSMRLDHNISNNHRLMLRANVSPSTVNGIQVGGEAQVFGQNAYSRTSLQTYRDLAGVGQETWTIGNNKVNEFRFQYARRGLLYDFSSGAGGSDVASNIPGYAFIGREPYSFIQRVEQRYQATDNFSWSFGKHNVKFGGDFNYIPVDATFTVNYGGVYSFGAQDAATLGFSNICAASGAPAALCPSFPAFTGLQAYGLGIPTDLVQGIGNPKDSFHNIPLGVFFQDSWKMRRNLTLNLGVRYDVEFAPKIPAPTGLALAAYNQLGIQKGIQTDTNNVQPRVGIAWDTKGDGKSVFRASYGMFYDHPLLGLYFLGDASDASKSGQLLFAGGTPCSTTAPSPTNLVLALNASNTFQGIQTVPTCLPLSNLGYLPNEQRFNSFLPNSLFLNQTYLQPPPNFFPLAFQPFGYPQAKNFVYAYSEQANLTFEQDLGHDMALSLAYNFNGGHHLNRPINANTVRGDLLVTNWQRAIAAKAALPTDNPLFVSGCGVGPAGAFVPAALVNFFRPSGLNPAIAAAVPSSCVALAQQVLQAAGLNASCDPATLANCVPFSDMDAQYSNGSSVYHGFTANLRKRFGHHYQFLGSYTWSHAIDDSTDLQSPLAPQDSFFPSLERGTSFFDQRHRFVFSAVYQSGRVSGNGFTSKLLSNWTIAPIVEVASGRPFNILTGSGDNFQFAPDSSRPNIVPAGTPDSPCGPTVASKYSPTGFFQEPCFVSNFNGTLLSLDGNSSRNPAAKPYTVFNDLRVSRRINLGERVSLDAIVDMFNIANKFNVSDVNPLFTTAGQPTAAYDPRQFQFALKVNW
ncbi:MAG TPA: carboxypeptidase regulatory-like domain-containing protein [Terriglobales bacterium]|nr:carboxypeptidase regulatory-like domain-containing protein [Terriglobales bacterium]